MQPRTLTIVALLLAVSTIVGVAAAKRPTTAPVAPLTLSEVDSSGIAGRLGCRLGTVVTLAGQIVANSSRAKADVDEVFFLKVERVDGKSLHSPALFTSRDLPLVRGIPALKVGDKFQCAGYETGEYTGSPPGEFKYVPAYATTGFGFGTRFVVLPVN